MRCLNGSLSFRGKYKLSVEKEGDCTCMCKYMRIHVTYLLIDIRKCQFAA